MINNTPFYGTQGMGLQRRNLRSFKGAVTVELSRGMNVVQVSCLNSLGVESLRQTFNVNYTPTQPVAKPDLYVVTVGINQYQHSGYDLEFAADDAVTIDEFFNGLKDRYSQVHSLQFIGQGATKEKIITKTRKLLKQTRPDDQVILFIAGHGLLDEQLNYFFATYNIDFEQPKQAGLSYDEIEDLLDGIGARKKLLLLDTCHAGEVDKPTTIALTNREGLEKGVKAVAIRAKPGKSYIGLVNSFLLMQELFADLRRGSGAVVIAAASGVQYAFEADGSGVFTHALLEGLREKTAGGMFRADRNGDGVVKVSELRDWVTERVRQATDGRQVPIARRENIQVDWIIF